MQKKISLILGLLISSQIFSQSAKTVLIEHFTNTKCSICASRNPGFYSTLASYPQVIHIAFHPSAPYSSCFFSQQNKTENDDRTYFYNTYGSTPDFFLNGKFIPNSNPAITNTTIDTALNQTSPIEVSATEELFGIDSVKARITVRTTGNVGASELLLFAGVAQDTVQYSAGNGEQLHHDVFRKALTKVKGDTIQVPAFNDSLVLYFTYKIQSGWREANLSTIAFVQLTDTKQVLNATKSYRVISIPSAIGEIEEGSFSIYPNPVRDVLEIRSQQLDFGLAVMIFDLAGRKVSDFKLSQNRIDISGLAKGIYFLKINSAVKKFVKE